MKTMDTTKAVQMLQHIYDMLETADDSDDIQEVQRAVHSYLEDLQPNTPIRTTKAGEEEEASILGELPDKKNPLDKPDWADSAFDVASDDDQSKYFSRADGVLEANPELRAMYDKEPSMRLGEELWDIDNKNPNPRYTTLKDYIGKHKFNVPVGRYSGKPETEYYKNVLALMGDSDDHFGEEQAEGLDNLLEGLRDTPHDDRW